MQLISTHPIKKMDLGFHGNLFGGKCLSWVDDAGAQKVNVNVIVMDPIDYNSMVTELERLRRKNQFKL